MNNVWIDPKGLIRVKLPKSDAGMFDMDRNVLIELDREHPYTLASSSDGRDRLKAALNISGYQFAPDVHDVIAEAIDEGKDMATPVTTVTDFELSAYCDEVKTLLCNNSMHGYQAGKRYSVTTWVYRYNSTFTRNKTHFGEKFYAQLHQCRLNGKDRALRVWLDQGKTDYVDFLDRPHANNNKHRHLRELWNLFDKPKIKTVAERFPAKIRKNLKMLDTLEMLGGFDYFDGQRDYLARVGCKSHGYVVAEAGCGKSNFALSLIGMKGAKRSLIIAPQGTVKGESTEAGMMSASQWAEEVTKFAPCMDVYELFSMKDYHKLVKKNGVLPHGIYITYYQALFYNDAVERCPKKMTDGQLLTKHLGVKSRSTSQSICRTVGQEKNGIRSVVKPSMATLIGDQFDMVCIDEAHMAQNNKSLLTESVIRLQPKYRFAFSATPIPNDISNLFAIMGWLCMPDWYKGQRCNAAFPFTREDAKRFEYEYMSMEEDLTAAASGVKKHRTKSPIISSPSHLVKILKSTMSFISKADCNPDYNPPSITNVRVDMGKQQSKLYAHYMDKANVMGHTNGIKATNQFTTLRSVCAEPYGSTYNEGRGVPVVTSPFNPKLMAMLEIIQDKLALGEQVTVISSRTSTSDMLQGLLKQCGIECARIDTKTSGKHSKEANRFKRGDVPVMLMGIKCAAAHSFSQCRNLIVSSIEWSNGTFVQCIGRVDRINSPMPPNIYVILYRHSIEEVMYDMMTIRNDAATLCIKGEYPKPSQPVDMDEILAHSIVKWREDPQAHDEMEYEKQWITIRKDIQNGRAKTNKCPAQFGNVQVAAAPSL